LRGGLLDALLAVNVVMVLFNLLPAFPMDGGRVLRALLAFKLPYARATRIASTVGQVMSLLFGIVGLFTGQFMLLLVALFVFLAAGDERAMVETRASLVGLPVHAAMLTDFHRLDASDPLRRAVNYLMAGSQQDFPVLHGLTPVGTLTRHDLIAALQRGGIEATVGEAMTAGGGFADVDEPLEAVLARMRAVRATSLPVLAQGRLVGLLTLDNVGDLVLVRDALKRYAGGA
jgi:CBS domain-containing protein